MVTASIIVIVLQLTINIIIIIIIFIIHEPCILIVSMTPCVPQHA